MNIDRQKQYVENGNCLNYRLLPVLILLFLLSACGDKKADFELGYGNDLQSLLEDEDDLLDTLEELGQSYESALNDYYFEGESGYEPKTEKYTFLRQPNLDPDLIGCGVKIVDENPEVFAEARYALTDGLQGVDIGYAEKSGSIFLESTFGEPFLKDLYVSAEGDNGCDYRIDGILLEDVRRVKTGEITSAVAVPVVDTHRNNNYWRFDSSSKKLGDADRVLLLLNEVEQRREVWSKFVKEESKMRDVANENGPNLDNPKDVRQLIGAVARSIVLLQLDKGKCMGTIIDADKILTAGHCFRNNAVLEEVNQLVRQRKRGGMRLVPKLIDDVQRADREYEVIGETGNLKYDLVIVDFVDQLFEEYDYVAVNEGLIRAGQRYYSLSPYEGHSIRLKDWNARSGTVITLDDFNATYEVTTLSGRKVKVELDESTAPPLVMNARAGAGDSGGPIISFVNGEPRVVGVLSGSAPRTHYGNIGNPLGLTRGFGDNTLFVPVNRQIVSDLISE